MGTKRKVVSSCFKHDYAQTFPLVMNTDVLSVRLFIGLKLDKNVL